MSQSNGKSVTNLFLCLSRLKVTIGGFLIMVLLLMMRLSITPPMEENLK